VSMAIRKVCHLCSTLLLLLYINWAPHTVYILCVAYSLNAVDSSWTKVVKRFNAWLSGISSKILRCWYRPSDLVTSVSPRCRPWEIREWKIIQLSMFWFCFHIRLYVRHEMEMSSNIFAYLCR
jgi:hypothetical protein